MATGSLTSMILTAGASMLANGSDVTIGGKPISSASGAPLSVTDSINNETGAPTLYTMNYYTKAIQSGPLSALYTVTTKIDALADNYKDEWSSMTSGLGDSCFSAVVDLYSGNAYSVLHTANSVESVLTFGRTESASVLGGSISGGEIEGNAKKFGTSFGTATAFVDSSNQFINASNNASELFTGGTFPGIDSVISGSITGVSLASSSLGSDITKIGDVINWRQVTNFGSPGQLLRNMLDNGTLGPMYSKVATISVNPRIAATLGANLSTIANLTSTVTLGSLGIDINEVAEIGANLPRSIQQQIYDLFAGLSANELLQVKAILRCTQVDINNGADLFNPVQLFANSYMTLTAPVSANGISSRAIYMNTSGSVNEIFVSLGARLESILPTDLAIANGAVARSLLQIKNVESTDTQTFSTAVSATETLKDLTQIQNLTTYIPAGVIEYWTNYYGLNSNIQLATGPESNFTVADCLGYAAGYNSALPIKQMYSQLTTMNSAGNFDVFFNDAGSSSSSTGAVIVLEYLIDGAYDPDPIDYIIPVGVYGAGTYATFSGAYTAVITAIQGLLTSVYSGNTTAQSVQSNFKRIQEQLAREKLNRVKMDLVLTDVQTQDSNALLLAGSLSSYALEATSGGPGEYLERIANFSSLGGQAMIAAMREARNSESLGAAQIQLDGVLDTTPPANPGTFLSSQYTNSEAEAQIVR